MEKFLKEIATIHTGIYAKSNPMGNVNYIQGNSVDEDYLLLKPYKIPKLVWKDNFKKHLLREKDILFMAKGDRNVSVLYNPSLDRSVASSTFFVLRLNNVEILPEYLKWYLNSLYEMGKTKSLLKGTYIPSISKKSLEKLEIPVPSFEIQRKILHLSKLWEKEKMLTRNLLDKKEQYYQNILNRIVNQ